MELAVCGKLVPQDPNDEPASILLERIAAEKAQLVKDKKIKKPKPLPEIGEEEKPFELPTGWEWIRLESVSDINGGFAFKSSQYVADGVRVIRISDFDEKGFKDEKIVRYQYSALLDQYLLEEQNILMAMTGGTVGKSLLVEGLHEKMVVNQRVATIKISPRILSQFISCAIQTRTAQDVIHDAKNSTNDNISMSDIKGFFIPIPSLAEQHRIVAKVDELMALCDQLEQQTESSLDAHNLLVDTLLATLTDAQDAAELSDSWARLAEHFDTLITTDYAVEQLKQTILQLAVQGKLVTQDPNDEPASELLKRIATEKAQLIKDKKLKPTKKASHFKEPIEFDQLPNGWVAADFGDITFNRDAERIPLSVGDRSTRQGAYDYYGASGVIDSIDSYLFDEPLLLIGEDGANLVNRSTPIAFMAHGKYWVNNHAHVVDGISEDFLMYLELYINSISLIPYITGMAQPKMNQAKMNSIFVALPPENEQLRILNKVSDLWTLCDRLKADLQQTQTTQLHIADAVTEQALA